MFNTKITVEFSFGSYDVHLLPFKIPQERSNKEDIITQAALPVIANTPKISMKKRIENFVESFLHPYISGQITKETESKDRRPMIELLCEQLDLMDWELREAVEEIALQAYFEKAAMGFYINQHLIPILKNNLSIKF